ncbi:MAG: hemolysin family protein, partial [Verrucomicrobia bacterium]|nr:hemolysin family protein [Verrucomicrobiota bacterium]
AKMARHIIRGVNSYIAAVQLGMTMVSLGLGYLGQPVFTAILDPFLKALGVDSVAWQHSISFAVGFTALTFLHITAGELAPKWMTIQRPLPVALWLAYPLRWFYLAFYPFIRLLNAAVRRLLSMLGLEADGAAQGQSEAELRVILASAQGTAAERNVVLNALDLRRRTVREVMRPRREIALFHSDASLADCIALAEKSRYSRFPVCDGGDVDKTRGIIHIKDLHSLAREGRVQTARDLVAAARKPIYVPPTASLGRTLQLFLERKSHFAMIVDEYGGALGMATLENVLEALVGQIQDEFDTEKSEITAIAENVWEASGTIPLRELEKITGDIEHDETIATASGWMTLKLGGFPKVGDTLTVGDCEIRVEDMRGTRVGRMRIIKHGAAADTAIFQR